MSLKKSTSFPLALAAVLVTVFAVWFANRPIAINEGTWEDVLAEAEAGGYRIITTEELAELVRRDSPAPLLIDTRQEWEYRTGHIADAVNFPMEPTWWERWRKADELRELLGPDKERSLIFY